MHFESACPESLALGLQQPACDLHGLWQCVVHSNSAKAFSCAMTRQEGNPECIHARRNQVRLADGGGPAAH
eukprot:scaffold104558_cov15-Tisochrysis_lutea.AAC.1